MEPSHVVRGTLRVAGTAAALMSSVSWHHQFCPQVVLEIFGERCANYLLFAAWCGAGFAAWGLLAPLERMFLTWAGRVETTLEIVPSAPNSHALRIASKPRSRTRISMRRQLVGGLGNLLSGVARRFAIRIVPQPRLPVSVGRSREVQPWSPPRHQLQQQQQQQSARPRRRHHRPRELRTSSEHSTHSTLRRIKVPIQSLSTVTLSPRDHGSPLVQRLMQRTEPHSPADSATELPYGVARWRHGWSKMQPFGRSGDERRSYSLPSPSSVRGGISVPRRRSLDISGSTRHRHVVQLFPSGAAAAGTSRQPMAGPSFQHMKRQAATGLRSHPLAEPNEWGHLLAGYDFSTAEEASTPLRPLAAAGPPLRASHAALQGLRSHRLAGLTEDDSTPPPAVALAPHETQPPLPTGEALQGPALAAAWDGPPPAAALLDCPELRLEDPERSVAGSLGRDSGRGGCPPQVAATVTDAHLHQFGALIGEAPTREALAASGTAWALGCGEASLFGVPEAENCRWERLVQETQPQNLHQQQQGLSLSVWRAPLRNGLYMYTSRAVYEGTDAATVRAFALDDEARREWDDNHVDTVRLPLEGGASSRHSCLQHYRSKFGPFHADREYVYARRVWERPSDGGCYALSLPCTHPKADLDSRAVLVRDHVSAFVVRAVPSVQGLAEGAVEIVTVYFEDSSVGARLMNSMVKRNVWKFTRRHEEKFREYARARQQYLVVRAERAEAFSHANNGSELGGEAGGACRPSHDGDGSDSEADWSFATMRVQSRGGCGVAGRHKWRRNALVTTASFLVATFLARK